MKTRHYTIALLVLGVLAGSLPAEAQVTPSSVTLSWTTPGDDGTLGTASQFDLRYSTSPITGSNFNQATRWASMPAPAASGTRQNVTVTGLSAATTYYFAIKTADESGNWAPVSNVAQATTAVAPDLIRPAALAISLSAPNDTTVTVSWAAVGDDSLNGTAASYDVRYSTSPITSSNWSSATPATGEPVPAVAGTAQSLTVSGLQRQGTYYFAAKVADEAGNVSALSNVPSITTPDSMPPAAIRDLAVGWLFIGWHGLAADRPRAAYNQR
jgi:chitodextrinase